MGKPSKSNDGYKGVDLSKLETGPALAGKSKAQKRAEYRKKTEVPFTTDAIAHQMKHLSPGALYAVLQFGKRGGTVQGVLLKLVEAGYCEVVQSIMDGGSPDPDDDDYDSDSNYNEAGPAELPAPSSDKGKEPARTSGRPRRPNPRYN